MKIYSQMGKKSMVLQGKVWMVLVVLAALFLGGTAELVPVISKAPSFVAENIEQQVDHNTELQSDSNCPTVPDKIKVIESSPIFAGSQPNPMSFLSSRLSQFTKATRIFTTRDYAHSNVAAEFHQACDNVPNTLVIIKSGQYIAGGFTEVAWSSKRGYIAFPSVSSGFLFSANKQENYNPKEDMLQNGLWCDLSYGPSFGEDIGVRGDYNRTDNYSWLGFAFRYNRSGYSYSELLGSEYFTIDEYEVYKLE